MPSIQPAQRISQLRSRRRGWRCGIDQHHRVPTLVRAIGGTIISIARHIRAHRALIDARYRSGYAGHPEIGHSFSVHPAALLVNAAKAAYLVELTLRGSVYQRETVSTNRRMYSAREPTLAFR